MLLALHETEGPELACGFVGGEATDASQLAGRLQQSSSVADLHHTDGVSAQRTHEMQQHWQEMSSTGKA